MNSKGYKDLRERQHEAIEFCDANPFSALWIDMGLGKTVLILTLIRRLLRQRRNRRFLIIAPIRVAMQTWPGEIAEWTHLAKLSYQIIRPTGNEPEIAEARENARQACAALGLKGAQRASAINRAQTRGEERARRRLVRGDEPIHIINRELLPWLVWYWGDRWPYDGVIFDESSGLRSHSSDRFRALARVRKYITRLHELTGTPKPETYMDIFPQLWLLDKGQRLGSNVTQYRNRYFGYHAETFKWIIRKGAHDQIIAKIKDIVLVQQDLSGAHDPILIDRPITLANDELDKYQQFEASSVMTLEGTEIEAGTAGALAQKLLQFSSGAVYDAERKYTVIHNHKIHELQQIKEEALGSPLAVAYWHKSSLDRLKKAFPEGQQMDKQGNLQHPWNKGDVPMMFLHPASAGHGLNLQKGPGHILVFFDIPYPLELYLQIIKRFAREGQQRQVRVYHLVAQDTIDSGIVPRLKRKESSQDYIMKRITELRL